MAADRRYAYVRKQCRLHGNSREFCFQQS